VVRGPSGARKGPGEPISPGSRPMTGRSCSLMRRRPYWSSAGTLRVLPQTLAAGLANITGAGRIRIFLWLQAGWITSSLTEESVMSITV
jgi:hypothetical protein